MKLFYKVTHFFRLSAEKNYFCSNMDNIELILKYFPDIDATARRQFECLGTLYPEWNAKINVISRKDIDSLYVNHILHSLAIARFLGPLEEGTTMLDLGTGGGFPGIPLAIAYPECRFHLIDRIGKKINVASEIAKEIGLDNVTFQHGDIGECHDSYDYVVSRAVMALDRLVKLSAKNVIRRPPRVINYAPGIVCLKGGDLSEESADVRYPVIEYPLSEFFDEDRFDTKKLVYVPVK